MGANFSRTIKQDAVYGVLATAASTVYSDKIDLSGYKGVLITALFKSTGASTGHCTFTVVGANSTATDSTSYTAITGASVTVEHSTTANDKRVCSLDICQPIYRYVKAKLVKQAGILLNGLLAQKYGAAVEPTAASTTYAGSTAALSNVLTIGAT
ncbi:MAG: hypothetical protein WC390_11250 [Sulfurimonas sp.]|jgi:hypothetical protein